MESCDFSGGDKAAEELASTIPKDTRQSEEERRVQEAASRALTLEIIGDLPSADIKPPENVLFVCKLNPVTEEDDLHLIFSRFGPIKG